MIRQSGATMRIKKHANVQKKNTRCCCEEDRGGEMRVGKDGKMKNAKAFGNNRQPTNICAPHGSEQHQEDQVIPPEIFKATALPGTCHLKGQTLQKSSWHWIGGQIKFKSVCQLPELPVELHPLI